MNKNKVLGIIGCGKMGSAILGGIIKNNFLNPEDVYVYDVNDSSTEKLSLDYGVNIVKSISDLLKITNTLLLAVKPFVVNEVLNEIKENYDNHLVMSILAGVRTEKYLSFIKDMKLIRVMPNTPALVNMGMSAICASDNVNEDDKKFAFDFMKNCGEVIETTEDKMDVITALSGSGPAFYFKIIDLMARSAEKLGLDYKQALILSAQTAMGSAKMIFENNFDVEQLIKNVTTPKGCTEVGNNVINNSDMDKVLDKTIKETTQRAVELG